jgi:hypothetical protein
VEVTALSSAVSSTVDVHCPVMRLNGPKMSEYSKGPVQIMTAQTFDKQQFKLESN